MSSQDANKSIGLFTLTTWWQNHSRRRPRDVNNSSQDWTFIDLRHRHSYQQLETCHKMSGIGIKVSAAHMHGSLEEVNVR